MHETSSYYETSAIKPTEAISMLAFCSPIDLNRVKSMDNASSSWSSSSSSSSSSSKNASSSDSSMKKVRFCTLEVRKYPITIGDNPSVSWGVPYTIEWDHMEEETVHVDAYERRRQSVRRYGEELLLDSRTRIQILKSMGYTKEQIRAAIHAKRTLPTANTC